MFYEIRSVEIWPVVKIAFFVCAILGLLFGMVTSLLLWVFSSLIGTVMSEEIGEVPRFSLAVVLVMGAIWAPVYGAIGSVFAGIAVALYNLLARWIGGIELNLKAVQEEEVQVAEIDQGIAHDR